MHREIASTTGEIRKGKLLVRGWQRLAADVKRQRDCQVLVRVERLEASRSLPQLRYYWAVVVQAISDHTGYSPDDVHELMKKKFLPKRLAVCDGNGEVKGEFVIGGSTRKLTVEEFSRYIDDIRLWAVYDLNVDIPVPPEAM